jgi:hypothetical protein
MSSGERNWDKELAAIDGAIDRMAAGSGSGPAPPPPPPPPARASAGRAVTATWLRVLLAVVLAAALPLWPFLHACGFGLAGYLGLGVGAVVAGIWGAAASWRHRRPVAHVVTLLAALWAMALLAREILPRIGYAKESGVWLCP